MRIIALSVAALAVTVSSAAALQADGGTLDYDLVQINLPGNPLHPGVDYTYEPISPFAAEATGVSAADFNNDGWIDLMFASTEGHPNHLYVNNQDGTFTESAVAYGVDEPSKRRGQTMFFDYDNDGDLDLMTFGYPNLVVPNFDLYSFFRNDGAGAGYTFTDVTAGVGGFVIGGTVETTTVGDPGGVAVADYDNDGYLDVLVSYWHRNNQVSGYSDDQFRLWHNQPNPAPDLGQPDYSPRIFVDATGPAGLDGLGAGWNWQPIWHDFNRDGHPDIFLCVEMGEDLLILNDGDGTFTSIDATAIGMNFNGPEPIPGGAWGHEMGVALVDHDMDGDMDVYITNPGSLNEWKHDAFYRNESDLSLGGGGLQFNHIGPVNGVTAASDGIGWGIVFPDLDNDGDQDIVQARGLEFSVASNDVFQNEFPAVEGEQDTIVWTELTDQLPGYALPEGTMDTARSLTALDFDNDGDLDLVTTRSGSVPVVPGERLDAVFTLNTLSNANDWIGLDLLETGGSRATTGARVFVRTGGPGGPEQMKQVTTGSSFLAQEPYRQHFGLGTAPADYVAVRWADGGHSVLSGAGGPITGLQTIARGADVTGDLDNDGSRTCADLELLTRALWDEPGVDAQVPSTWPWRVLADIDGNSLIDTRDFTLLRQSLDTSWCEIGGGLAGSLGVPTLGGRGVVAPGNLVGIELANAKPSSPAFMFMGLGVWGAPLHGGILVPSFDFPLLVLFTDAVGEIALNGTWPATVPVDTIAQLQIWIEEGPGPYDFAVSNGLSAETQ